MISFNLAKTSKISLISKVYRRVHFQKADIRRSCCYFDPPSCAGPGGTGTPPIMPARFLGVRDIIRDHNNNVFDVVQSHTTSTGRWRGSGSPPKAGFTPVRPLPAGWCRSRLTRGSSLSVRKAARASTTTCGWCATLRHQKHD